MEKARHLTGFFYWFYNNCWGQAMSLTPLS